MKKNIAIGTRGSRLAEIQSRSVLTKLVGLYTDVEFSLTRITTTGDRQKTTPLDQIPGRGAFVRELEEALLDGRVDLTVHSLKDLPVQMPEGLILAAVTERLDARDVLVSQTGKLTELAPNSVIGTSSPRRTAQLLAYRSDLLVKPIRGNIDTRLQKVTDGEVDGIIVAAAGLIRLGWQDRITEYLPVEHFLPPAGQGTLAIEIRADNSEILELVRPLNHKLTWQSILAERAFLQAMGGGCSAAIACLGTATGDTLGLRGMAASDCGVLYASEEGSASAPEEVGKRLAERLLKMGALETTTKTGEQ